jgi:hypothetical protein
MIDVPATDSKLGEAEFFHRKLLEADRQVFSPEPEAFAYYLSAFVSAARSVTFALQAERKGEYDAWFPSWKQSLTEVQRETLDYFNDQRIATTHQTGILVTHESAALSQSEFLFAAAREGAQIQVWHPPGTPAPTFTGIVRTFAVGGTPVEVTRATDQYLQLVRSLVGAFKAYYAYAAA